MANLDAQRLLDLAILDYMSKRGFHQIHEAFSPEIHANPNPFTINFPHGAFLQAWWTKFFEAYNSRFPDDPVFTAESFDKVAQTVKNVVANNDPTNQSYASNHAGANISSVMPVIPSPHLVASSPMMESSSSDPTISNLLSSFDISYELPDFSLEMNEMGGMLPFASNSGYQMLQMPSVPPEWNARDDTPDINLGGPTQMEPNINAPTNALPPSVELSDAGNNGSLPQTSHQGWPSVDVVPNVAVQTLDMLQLPTPASSGDFFHMLTQADSSGKDAGMFGDTNQTTLANLPAVQQIIAPIGVIIESSGKQPAMQEQINQSDRKRKAPSSSRTSVEKGKAHVVGSAVPARTQARKGIAFEEIRSLHTTKSKLLCCHFNSQGELLATAGHDKKVLIWNLGNNNVVNSGEGHVHHITDVRFRPNSTVFATSSLDGTVKMWDAVEPSKPFGNLAGHAGHVMSIDFHPTKLYLLSSCDSNNEIRLWDIRMGDCIFNFKGGSSQVRFQPQLGNVLASSTGNIVNIFDVETNIILKRLQGHVEDVRSICWDRTGNCVASVSEDSARIWYVRDGECIHELNSDDNRFQSCTFHPGHGQVLVIGSDKFLELWNPIFQANITWSYSAHDGIVSSLANSSSKGTIASVSHDEQIKIWR